AQAARAATVQAAMAAVVARVICTEPIGCAGQPALQHPAAHEDVTPTRAECSFFDSCLRLPRLGCSSILL
ncbi:MAG: hypothetical protein KDF57_04035, partial [Ottowia sp.]|nr:hypothetical protein [Ottowia sp.]